MPPLDAAAAPSTPAPRRAQVGAGGPSGVYPDGDAAHGVRRDPAAAGRQFAEFEGWDWISDFGDPIAEHHTVRESVGIWTSRRSGSGISGPDALEAADYCFTADMASLEVGQAR